MTTGEIRVKLEALRRDDAFHAAEIVANVERRRRLQEACPHPKEETYRMGIGWIACKVCKKVIPDNPVVTNN